MDHTKVSLELAEQVVELIAKAKELKSESDSLRSALAEKTAQVERLRDALERIEQIVFDDGYGFVANIAREAIAATATEKSEPSHA